LSPLPDPEVSPIVWKIPFAVLCSLIVLFRFSTPRPPTLDELNGANAAHRM
jgi:hypothetical protein